MRADDHDDPLDRWLEQQVSPLPPPPGTFELITRRARRRKMRRLAVAVGSAAAVVVAAAIAVPVGLSLRLTPPPQANGHIAANSRSASSTGGTQTENGTATRDATPTPATATTPPGRASSAAPTASSTSPVVPPSGPVPANFAPTSVTFDSTSHGWVIGQAGTPGHCANKNPNICTSVARTDDAGKSWVGGPAPDTTGPNGPAGVSGIRFLDGVNGWAFGPELWATHDAGNTWTRVNTNGQRVTDLETAGNRAYALFASCSGASSAAFADGCTSYTLMTTTAGSDNWNPVSGATNGLTNAGAATSAMIALTSTTGYLVAPDGTLYSGPLGAGWQKVGTMRCQPGTPQANGLPSQALLALVNSTRLASACAGSSPTAPPTVYTSADGGAIWTASSAGWPGVTAHGTVTSLAAAPDGTLVLGTTAGIDYLTPGAAHWQQAGLTGATSPPGGFSYVGMTTSQQGVAVPADTSLHEVWMTFDGGKTWSPATSITPGN